MTRNHINLFQTVPRALVFALPFTLVLAQTAPKSAQDAADQIQALRMEGRRLMAAQPEEALAKFDAALRYWQQPLVQDLSRGEIVLESRYLNLCIDFADTHAKLGHKAQAIVWLEKVHQAGGWDGFAQYLEKNQNYAALKDEETFQKLVADSRQIRDFWEPAALNTPYVENLPDAGKIAGLSKFWSEVKYNFAYPERLSVIDWDRLYLDALPKVLATKSTAEYYRALMRLCASIGDGHTNVYFPSALKINEKPPIKTLLIDGHAAIVGVYARALEQQGIQAGMEILEVDSEDVHEYVKREIAPFQSASTPHGLTLRSYWYGFLSGPRDKPVRLKLRSPDGLVVEKTVARTGYTETKYPDIFEYRTLDNGVAYVRVDGFDNSNIVTRWKENLPQIRAVHALILDLRSNGGGSRTLAGPCFRA